MSKPPERTPVPDRARRPRPVAAIRRAFTLAELAVSLAVSSILIVGAGAVLTTTMKQVDRGRDANATRRSLSRTLDAITADCAVATAIDRSSPYKLILTVPDRTGDNTPETISYVWSNQRNGTITRTFNAESSIIATGIDSFTFTTNIRPAPVISTTSIQSLYSYDPNNSQSKDFDDTTLFAAAFQASAPSGTTSWSITSVKLRIGQSGGTAGTFVIELRNTVNNAPGNTVLASTTVAESTLSDSEASWVSLPLTATNLSPGVILCVVVRSQSGSGNIAGSLGIKTSGNAAGQITWISTTRGSTWSSPSSPSYSIPLIVNGTFTTKREQ